MTQYTGSCQCGVVRYTGELDLTHPVLECNCSICSKKGLLLSFTPSTGMELISGDDDMIEYRFNTHNLRHRFCKVCGVQCFCEGEKDGNLTHAINVRTIDDIDLSKLNRQPFDGKSL